MKNELLKKLSGRFSLMAVMITAFLMSNPLAVLADTYVSYATVQTDVIRGQVVDANGDPIIGASVIEKGTSNGTITDLDGNFSLNVSSSKAIVSISYIGYKTIELPASDKKLQKVVMQEDSEVLSEVVVVGYGLQKKASLTGAISQVKGDDVVKDRGVSSAAVALQGEIPGLVVTRSSTRPGSEGVEMKIRGDVSVNGNSSPLVLIDGIPGSLDELNQIDGKDIENISVLKDASAAIYGARSASGVILVTTKRGKKGKAQISYSGTFSTTIDGVLPSITTNEQWLYMWYYSPLYDYKFLFP